MWDPFCALPTGPVSRNLIRTGGGEDEFFPLKIKGIEDIKHQSVSRFNESTTFYSQSPTENVNWLIIRNGLQGPQIRYANHS